VRALLAHVDAIRLDHFRGFVAAWHVPAGAASAQSGQWVQGPGADFFDAVSKELGSLPFIVEDLGIITPDVHSLRDHFQLPGTRVLQFAFDGHADNPYLPHNFVPNSVVYTGTHDNAPTHEWYEELPDYQRQNFWNYLKRAPGGVAEASPALMQLAWSSPAALAIAPLQDLLNLGAEGRMNVPGRASGNWRWRSQDDMLSYPAFDWLRELTERSMRSGARAAVQPMNAESDESVRAASSQV
jgi:4-alpha-glucanotransferase